MLCGEFAGHSQAIVVHVHVCPVCTCEAESFYAWEWLDAACLFASAVQWVFTYESDSTPAVCLCFQTLFSKFLPVRVIWCQLFVFVCKCCLVSFYLWSDSTPAVCLKVLLSEFLPVRGIRCLCLQALLSEFLPVRVIRCLCLQALFSEVLLVRVIRRWLFVFVCKCCSVFSTKIILLRGMLSMFHLPLIMKLHFFSLCFNSSLCVNMMALHVIVISVLWESRWWWGWGLQCVLQCVFYLLKCTLFICRYLKKKF